MRRVRRRRRGERRGPRLGGRCRFVAVTDKITSGEPYFVETGHTQPPGSLAPRGRPILDAARRGIEALGLDAAAFHAELRLGPSGPRLMEIGARLGGDRITSDLVPLSTGVDLCAAVIPRRAGGAGSRPCGTTPARPSVTSCPSRHRGVSEGEADSRAVEGLVDWVLDVGVGDVVPPLENSPRSRGSRSSRAPRRGRGRERAERSRALLRIVTRP